MTRGKIGRSGGDWSKSAVAAGWFGWRDPMSLWRAGPQGVGVRCRVEHGRGEGAAGGAHQQSSASGFPTAKPRRRAPRPVRGAPAAPDRGRLPGRLWAAFAGG